MHGSDKYMCLAGITQLSLKRIELHMAMNKGKESIVQMVNVFSNFQEMVILK